MTEPNPCLRQAPIGQVEAFWSDADAATHLVVEYGDGSMHLHTSDGIHSLLTSTPKRDHL